MIEELQFCECGCGERVVRTGNRFLKGHNRRGIPSPHISPAQIAGDEAQRGVPNSLEHNAAISEAKRGVPCSEKRRAAISAAKIGVPHTSSAQIAGHKTQSETTRGVLHTSEAQLAADKALGERFRGGHDIVQHHYLYDDADLSKYTMPMTRSEHAAMHCRMRKDGYEVSHINSETDDAGLWGYK